MSKFLKKLVIAVFAFALIFFAYANGDIFKILLARAQSIVVPGASWQSNFSSNITATSGAFNGNLTSMGGDTSASVWFEWRSSYGQSSPTVRQSSVQTLAQIGNYSINLTGLLPEMRYCAVLVAENTAGRYENATEQCFTTLAPSSDADIQYEPVPLTYAANAISANAATLNQKIEGVKSSETANLWFEWKGPNGLINSTEQQQRAGRGTYAKVISGLTPSTRYSFRAVADKLGMTRYGNWEYFSTAQGQAGQRFYYCHKDTKACNQTGEYADATACINDLLSFHGSNIISTCFSSQTDCRTACDNLNPNPNPTPTTQRYYFCSSKGQSCRLTDDYYASLALCTDDMRAIYGDKICYTASQRDSCDSICQSGSSNAGKQYYFCNKETKVCSLTLDPYRTANECVNDLSSWFGSRIVPECFSNKPDCDYECQGASSGRKYFYCNKSVKSCYQTGSEYASAANCASDLSSWFGDKILPRCYETQPSCYSDCAGQQTVPPTAFNYYYYCSKTEGACKKTNGRYSSPTICRDSVAAVYGDNTTQTCYGDYPTCSNNCNYTPPPPAPTGQYYYYCMSDAGQCPRTDGKYASKADCQSDIQYKYGSKTNGICYDDNVSCSNQCSSSGSEVINPDNPPSSFDWRKYKGKNWMTPPENQGAGGGCWTFSANGSTEAKYKIEKNDASLPVNLSEQYLLSCSGQGSSQGAYNGNMAAGLAGIREGGTVDELCFPFAFASYNGIDAPCDQRCSNWQSRLWKIQNYYFAAGNDRDIKTALIKYGPLLTTVFAGYSITDAQGNVVSEYTPQWWPVMRCDRAQIRDNILHTVVLVGYDDMQGYWIMKNSWGPAWNGDGYFKVGYGECLANSLGTYYAQGVIAP